MVAALKPTVHVEELNIPDFGRVHFALSSKGLRRLQFGGGSAAFQKKLESEGYMVVRGAGKTAEFAAALKRYFSGSTKNVGFSIDWGAVDGFSEKVLRACSRIPHGETRSYGDLAKSIGEREATRAVGNALGRNPFPIVVPCHRVLRSDGAIGGFTGGPEFKVKLLQTENPGYRPPTPIEPEAQQTPPPPAQKKRPKPKAAART